MYVPILALVSVSLAAMATIYIYNMVGFHTTRRVEPKRREPFFAVFSRFSFRTCPGRGVIAEQGAPHVHAIEGQCLAGRERPQRQGGDSGRQPVCKKTPLFF